MEVLPGIPYITLLKPKDINYGFWNLTNSQLKKIYKKCKTINDLVISTNSYANVVSIRTALNGTVSVEAFEFLYGITFKRNYYTLNLILDNAIAMLKKPIKVHVYVFIIIIVVILLIKTESAISTTIKKAYNSIKYNLLPKK